MIAIVDYGVGNLFSLKSSLEYLGLESEVTADEKKLVSADKIILPGVGAFGDAAEKLKATGLVPLIKEQSKVKPLLGICLGMQLLFERGLEYGVHEGLGLLSGDVVKFDLGNELKVPHMGWNSLNIENKDCPMLRYTSNGEYVYFVHSYHALAKDEDLAATSCYGHPFAALVWKDNVYGAQFHPEKSGETGLKMLKAFGELK